MKVVINAGYGGFSVSRKAFLRLRELKFQPALDEPLAGEADPQIGTIRTDDGMYLTSLVVRHDPALVEVIEALGPEADGQCASLRIIEIPDGTEYEIESGDSGWEWVAEKHRRWYADDVGT